jgi:hypothetical protein
MLQNWILILKWHITSACYTWRHIYLHLWELAIRKLLALLLDVMCLVFYKVKERSCSLEIWAYWLILRVSVPYICWECPNRWQLYMAKETSLKSAIYLQFENCLDTAIPSVQQFYFLGTWGRENIQSSSKVLSSSNYWAFIAQMRLNFFSRIFFNSSWAQLPNSINPLEYWHPKFCY